MSHPGGGKNDIPERLKRHFVVLNCPMPRPTSLNRICRSLVLGHYSVSNGFASEVVAAAEHIPALAQQVWRATKDKMLPTPAKFHYTFNLRDLSQIFRGLMRGDASIIRNADLLLRLWAHESKRVLSDRFTSPEDASWFDDLVMNAAPPPEATKSETSWASTLVARSNTWCSFLEPEEQLSAQPQEDQKSSEAEDKVIIRLYRPAESIDALRSVLEAQLERYNSTIRGPGLKLVFFDDAISNMCRIARILSSPGASAMLVGVGGSGKKSLTKLAAFVVGSQLFQITVTRSYTVSNLMDDLKILCRMTGCEGKSVTFLLTDAEIREESFLGYVNALLTSGEIPGLFPKDEVLGIIADVRPAMQAEKPDVIDTPENVWKYFVERVRLNLHIVLCFSPVSAAFRTRSLKFPALFNVCTIIWLNPWPRQGALMR